jgi:hypothetical protein
MTRGESSGGREMRPRPFEKVPYAWQVITDRGRLVRTKVLGKCESRVLLRNMTNWTWKRIGMVVDDIDANEGSFHVIAGKKITVKNRLTPVTFKIMSGR